MKSQGKQPQQTKGCFPFSFSPKNIFKNMQFFAAQPVLSKYQNICRCLPTSVVVGGEMLNKASFCADRVYGFVCLLIFQVRELPGSFFLI